MNFKYSRSQLIRSKRCKKSLWLLNNSPELMGPSSNRRKRLSKSKMEVSSLARDLFPEGKYVESANKDYQEILEKTDSMVKTGKGTIFNGLFCHNDVFTKVDILKKEDLGWSIYEIKGSPRIKESHIYDLAFKYYLLKEAGVDINKAKIIYLNPSFVLHDELRLSRLFHFSDVTLEVEEKQNDIENDIKVMKTITSSHCPKVDIEKHCIKPHECDFLSHCWSHIPKDSIFDLMGVGIDKFESYRNGKITLKDINIDELNSRQAIQAQAELNNKIFIEVEKIKEFLDQTFYPLYFLDFESFQTPIPKLKNTKVYDQIPFQYSVHFKESRDSEVIHFEFLGNEKKDPREDLTKSLINHIKTDGCVIVYNMVFEKSVVRKLAEQYPEYKDHLLAIEGNIIDLMDIFKKRYYYKKEMKGSYSLKYVLPAIVPELHYNDFAISNGEDAMNSYMNLANMTDEDEIKKVRENLLEYCKLDTYGLFMVLEKLKGLV